MGFIIFKRFLASLLLLCFSACSSLLYFPTHQMYVRPERLQRQYEEVSLLSQGHKIFGWHLKHAGVEPAAGFLLFFHGNGQNRSAHYLALNWLLDHSYDYFIFDYQGYGESEGKPSPEGTVQDGLAALKWFNETAKTSTYKNTPLYIFAQSLGGPIALRSLEEFEKVREAGSLANLNGIILDSTFLSYQKVGAKMLSKHWLTYLFQPLGYVLLSDQWSPKNDLKDLPDTRYLVIHGDHDEVVDLSFGQSLFETLPEPKQWLLIEGGSHTNGFFIREGAYRDAFLKWLNK